MRNYLKILIVALCYEFRHSTFYKNILITAFNNVLDSHNFAFSQYL